MATTSPQRLIVPLPDDALPPRIGKIRLGHQVELGGGRTDKFGELATRPVAADHFVVTADEDGITLPETVAAFAEVYGAEPRQLKAMLIGDTPEANLEGAYRQYGTRKLKRRCDGATCSERTATGGWDTKPCACLAENGVVGADCKLSYTLHVLLPDVDGMGVWQIDTGSEISVRKLTGFLQMMHTLHGSLVGLEFDLRLVPESVAPDGKSKTVYVLDPRAIQGKPRDLLAGAFSTRPGYELPTPIADDVQDRLLHHDPDAADAPVALVKSALQALTPEGRAAARDVLTRHGVLVAGATPLRVAQAIIARYGDEAAADLGGLIGRLERELADGAEVVPDGEVEQLPMDGGA